VKPYSVLFRPTGSELNVGIGASTDFAWNFENTFMKRGAHSLSFEPYSIDGLRTANPVTSLVFVRAEDFPLYEKGLDWLHTSIRDLTRTAYRLEVASEPMPDEVERYYRISDRGQSLIEDVRKALDGLPESTEKLLAGIDQYLIRCSEILDLGDAEQDL